MSTQCLVTTSWDDGHQDDVRLAELLRAYDLPATFYISPFDREFTARELLNKRQVRSLSKDFEIGAHTLTHPHLTKISPAEAKREITGSKTYLEDYLGKKVLSFCYPAGYYNEEIIPMVQQAGFRIARTTHRYALRIGNNPFTVPTTFHAYNHLSDLHHLMMLSRGNLRRLYHYISWEYAAMDLFDTALETGSVFHIWGHSWEIDYYHAWDKLERLFRHISRHPQVSYRTNGELIV